MFYVKKKIKGKDVIIDIDYDNVFIKCCECEKEIMIDLVELAKYDTFDLYGTSACCVDCSQKVIDRIYSEEIKNERN